jgi:hypothetical protein
VSISFIRNKGKRTRIQAGQGAYWEDGEWHEAGTETGMIAIIIEAVWFDLIGRVPSG